MLRKATQGAVVVGAATLLALGSASPAMADSNYEFNNNDFGIDVLSDLCVAVYDVVDIVDVDVLVAQGGASCSHDETDIGVVHKDGYKHDHKHDYKHDYKKDYDRWDD
jgi:hypothetical protein